MCSGSVSGEERRWMRKRREKVRGEERREDESDEVRGKKVVG
jgi:hypothetical protein